MPQNPYSRAPALGGRRAAALARAAAVLVTILLAATISTCGPYPIPTSVAIKVTPPPAVVTPQVIIVAPPEATSTPTATPELVAPVQTEPSDQYPRGTRIPPPPISFLQRRITNLFDLALLPVMEDTTATQFSSRNWTALEHFFDYFNDDAAFAGPNYGYLTDKGSRLSYRIVPGYDGKPEYEIVPRVQGPGSIERIWFAYQQHQSLNNPKDMSANVEWNNWGNLGAMGNIRFYFDDEPVPRLDVSIKELFVGKQPFPAPLAAFYASADGGNINYVPIPFARSIRVTTTGRPRMMQIEIKRFRSDSSAMAGGTLGSSPAVSAAYVSASSSPLQSFTGSLSAGEQNALDQAAQAWSGCQAAETGSYRSFPLSIPHNTSAEVDFDQPGTFSSLRVRIPRGMDDSVWMQVFWDGENAPSMSAPLRGMFGTAERLLPYQALPMGIVSTASELIFYSHIPMPFRSARIVFVNGRAETLPLTLEVVTRDTTPGTERARLHALYGTRQMERREDDGDDYNLVDIQGSGKYLGAIFSAWDLNRQALNGPLDEHWRFPYLESNMDVWVDGHLALPGTGIEDDFNASYYYVFYGYPKYKTTYCLAGVTLLDYSSQYEPSSQYRFYLNDAPEFRQSLRVETEHGNKGNNLTVTYSSTAFWYQLK